MTALAVCAYNFGLVAGTAYLVFWRGESGWWFVLTALLTASIKEKDRKS